MSLLPKCICHRGSYCDPSYKGCMNRLAAPPPPAAPEPERGEALPEKKIKLDISAFSKLSAERAETGFKTYRNVPLLYWTTAIAGESGELCNMIKKIERVRYGGIDGGSSYTAADLEKSDIAEEIGGVFIYLNLLSTLLDIDMEEAIIETFNSKSKKYGFAQFYPPSPEPTTSGEEHIHVRLPSGAIANVSPDASPELLGALDKMCELAKKMPEKPGATSGEEKKKPTTGESLEKVLNAQYTAPPPLPGNDVEGEAPEDDPTYCPKCGEAMFTHSTVCKRDFVEGTRHLRAHLSDVIRARASKTQGILILEVQLSAANTRIESLTEELKVHKERVSKLASQQLSDMEELALVRQFRDNLAADKGALKSYLPKLQAALRKDGYPRIADRIGALLTK